MDLEKVFRPKSMAIVGATEKQGFGAGCAMNALHSPNQEHIYFVNPGRESVFGKKCYKSLSDLPEVVDFVAVCTPAASVAGILREAGQLGVKGATVLASGYSEENTPEGNAREQELCGIAEKYDMGIIGPNCLGLINNVDKVIAWAGPAGGEIDYLSKPTGVGIVTQSGFIASNIAGQKYLNLSYAVSAGNGNALTLDETMEFFADSDDVNVIAVYLEGIKKADVFARALEKAARKRKPVIVLKSGRSVKGAISASSHTGNLAGRTQSYEAVFKKFGVILVDNLDELLSTAQMFSVLHGRMPKKTGYAAVCFSGGESTIAADMFDKAGAMLADLQPETLEKMRKYLPSFATPKNPLDATTALFQLEDNVFGVLKSMAEDPNVGGIAMGVEVSGPAPRGNYLTASNAMIRCVNDPDCNVAMFCLPAWPDARNLEWRRWLESNGICVLSINEFGCRELRKLEDFIKYNPDEHLLKLAGPSKGGSKRKKVALTEFDSKAELRKYGVSTPLQFIAKDKEALKDRLDCFKFPVVLKISSPDIMHKTEAGGVKLGINSIEEAMRAYDEILASCKKYKPDAVIEGMLVQEMAKPGTEIIVGISNDVQFGPMILVGLGGVFVEVFKDAALYPCPISKSEALEMIRSLKAYKLLRGYRGAPACDVDALAELLVSVSNYAMENKETLAELDLNPVFVYPEGQGVSAVDALVVKYED